MNNLESNLSSAAAFVEGGVQEACDDSCSICLDLFCDSNPVTVTSCKHGYHLQCILEWAQRSKECPMCWQPLSLRDPSSQELLVAVEQERSATWSPSVLHRNSMGGFESHQVPVLINDLDFEERIMHHLAVAARARQNARRESLGNRSSSRQDHPQLVVVPTTHPTQPAGSLSDPRRARATDRTRTDAGRLDRYGIDSEHVEENQQRSALSEILSISESLKSRFAAVSSRYKETFTRTTKGFRERLRTQDNGISDLRACTQDMSAGVAQVLAPESSGKKRGEVDVPSTSSGTPVLNDEREPDISSMSEANSGSGCLTNDHFQGQGTSRALLQ